MKPAFDHCADDYAGYRPGYPDAVFELLAGRFGPPGGRTAADVGAGTGIFARRLAAAGWRVVALEPSVPMLRYALGCGGVPGVAAAAEAVPLADGSVNLVTAAQAAHWFNPRHALPELARVLRAGGGLALVWNNRDARTNAFVDAYESLVERYNPAYRRDYRQQDWGAKLDATGCFFPSEHVELPWSWAPAPEGFVGFARSCSYIRNVLSRESLSRFEMDLRDLIRGHFRSGPCHVPMTTELWLARRRRGVS